MEGDRLWAAPAEYVVVGRRWTYAPPPWVMYEAVVDDMEQWLSLLTAETRHRWPLPDDPMLYS
jgi:hypothetical protein